MTIIRRRLFDGQLSISEAQGPWALASAKAHGLLEAIEITRSLSIRFDRAQSAAEWASIQHDQGHPLQNNFGNALLELGERESGTAPLEEAVAACRAALEEWTPRILLTIAR